MVALYFMFYNFGRVHQTPRDASDGIWNATHVVVDRGNCWLALRGLRSGSVDIEGMTTSDPTE